MIMKKNIIIVFAIIIAITSASAVPITFAAATIQPAKTASQPEPYIPEHLGYNDSTGLWGPNSLLPAPKIFAIPGTTIVWRWLYTNPYRWNAYLSSDGGKTYRFDDWKYGDSRSYSPDGGSSYILIVGVDRSGKEITRHSNAVRPDDVP